MIVQVPDNEQKIEHAEVRLIDGQAHMVHVLKHGSYILAMMMSLMQNQAISVIATLMGIGKINFFVSIMFGILIGQVSYILAKRSYKEIEARSYLKFPKILSFIEDFVISMTSLKYALFLNLGFFCIVFLAQKFLSN